MKFQSSNLWYASELDSSGLFKIMKTRWYSEVKNPGNFEVLTRNISAPISMD